MNEPWRAVLRDGFYLVLAAVCLVVALALLGLDNVR